MAEKNTPHRAILVVDVQNEYDTGALRIVYRPVEESLRNIGSAMDAAHAAGVPVIVVQQMAAAESPLFAVGSNGWELHPVITSRPRSHYVPKRLPSAFADTDLGDWLKHHNIDTLTVVGYMTHNCIDTTIKHAFDAGLKVEFLMDASGSVSYANRAGFARAEEIHRVFSIVEQARYASVLTTGDWIEHLADGSVSEHDSIYASHQRALRAMAQRAVA